jgi:hypothetical protein
LAEIDYGAAFIVGKILFFLKGIGITPMRCVKPRRCLRLVQAWQGFDVLLEVLGAARLLH